VPARHTVLAHRYVADNPAPECGKLGIGVTRPVPQNTGVNFAAALARPRWAGGRRRGTFAAVLVTATAAATVAGASGVFGGGGVGASAGPRWLVVAEIAAALAVLAGVWAARAGGPRVVLGMAIAGAAALLPAWAAWAWLPAPLAVALVATAPLATGGITQAALAWPRATSPATHRAILSVYAAAGLAAVVYLVGYNPFADPGCVRTCADVPPLLRGVVSTATAAAATDALTMLAAAIGGYVVARFGLGRTPGWVAWSALVALAILAAGAVLRMVTWERIHVHPARVVAEAGAVAVLAAGLGTVAVDTARTRAAVERLVTRLSRPNPAASAGGRAIRDLAFAVPDEDRWVDAEGRPAPAGPSTARHVVLSDEAGPLVRLTTARPADTPEILARLSAATVLALRNAQLTAIVRARTGDVRASQRRVIATADAERQRIERDLHDGAQQRLVAVAIQLRVALASAAAPMAGELAATEALVRDALADLRHVTHGIHPRALTDEGLTAALDDLAASTDRPISWHVRLGEDEAIVGAEATMAAYSTIAATLAVVAAPGAATDADVGVTREARVLIVRVAVAATTVGDVRAALTDAADRVGAAGGQLAVTDNHDGHVVVRAVIPCGS
jgi:signal transduction histidine kinase